MPHLRGAVASSRRPYQRGLLAGILVVVILGAGLWYFLRPAPPQSNNPTIQQSNNSQIASVTPAPARTNAPPAKPDWTGVPLRERYDHAKCYRDAEGVLRDKRGGCRVIDPAATYHDPEEFASPPENAIFTRRCDRTLARLMRFRPGNIGIPDQLDYHSKQFEEDFQESLKEAVVVYEDDSPRTKLIKQSVIDARIEICKRINDGEKLGDILTETRSELRRLGDYRKNLTAELHKQLSDGSLSSDDAEAYIDAANKMFEANGIKPVKKSAMMRWNQRFQNEKGEEGK